MKQTPMRTAPALLLLLLCSSASASALVATRGLPRRPIREPRPVHMADPSLAVVAPLAGVLEEVTNLQTSHAFLYGILVTVATRYVIGEIRQRIEKPVLDELGNRVSQQLTPDQTQVTGAAWAKLAGCVALDLAGDASELIPFLGEFTDVGFAPVEAGLLKALFQSNAIAAFGFAEEILPFTDIIPTFTLAWCLSTLWPTTPLAQKLLPQASQQNSK